MVKGLTSSLWLLALAAQTSLAWKAGVPSAPYSYINYTTVAGFFLQDDPKTPNSNFDYTTTNFGLINRTYPTDANYTQCGGGAPTQWQRFARYVDSLNANSPDTIAYKVIFFARHGEGWHNAAESFYGTPAWNCYWSELDGNGTASWSDALLTDAGIAQAQKANKFWKSQLATQGMPAPQSYFTSPLSRCLYTANITFGDVSLPADRPFVPTVKEFLRESISMHTCDRRRSKTYIHDLFPGWTIEPGFPENDTLWTGTTAEDSGAEFARSKIALDEIFDGDECTWCSATSHSGEIGSLLSVLGHQPWSLGTGQAVPVLIRAERLPRAYPTATIGAWQGAVTCTAPPVTSLATGGCVCSTGATASPTAL